MSRRTVRSVTAIRPANSPQAHDGLAASKETRRSRRAEALITSPVFQMTRAESVLVPS